IQDVWGGSGGGSAAPQTDRSPILGHEPKRFSYAEGAGDEPAGSTRNTSTKGIVTRRSETDSGSPGRARPMATVLRPTIASSGWRTSKVRPSVRTRRNRWKG